MTNFKALSQKLPKHDYQPALQGAMSWLGNRTLLAEPVNRLAALYSSDFQLAGMDMRSVGLLLGGGAFLGWWGSWIAAARHLRSIEPTA